MQTVTTIGLDIAKSVFQVHGVDAAGQGVIRRRFEESSCQLGAVHTWHLADMTTVSGDVCFRW
jgi:hypothetical protein